MKAENYARIQDLMTKREPLIVNINALKGHTFRYLVFRNNDIECTVPEGDISGTEITIRSIQELIVALWEKRVNEIDKELEAL